MEHKRTGQIIAGVTGIAIIFALQRRFREYLLVTPALPSLEAPADSQLVFWFRLVSLGIFLLTCLAGFLLHRAGFLQGI
jgi:hypothetical protein